MSKLAKIFGIAAMCFLLMFGGGLTLALQATEQKSTSGTTTFEGDDNKEIIWNYLVGKGLSDEVAAGIMGNMQQESSLDTESTNTTSGAYGLCNWLDGRLEGLQNYAAARGKEASDIEVQLSYLWCELTDEEDNGIEGSYADNQFMDGAFGYTMDDLKAADSAHKATLIFGQCIERFGSGEEGSRFDYAESIYEEMKGTKASSSSSSSSSSSRKSSKKSSYDYGGWGCVSEGVTKSSRAGSLAKKYVELAKTGEMFNCGEGQCEKWVEEVLRHVDGIDHVDNACCATVAYQRWLVSSSRDDIPLGANVYGHSNPNAIDKVDWGGCGQEAGHVAIYIGDNQVISNEGGVATTRELFGDGSETWESYFGYRGWGWCGGIDLSASGDNAALVEWAESHLGLLWHLGAQGSCPTGQNSGEEYDCSGFVCQALLDCGYDGGGENAFGSDGNRGKPTTELEPWCEQNWSEVSEDELEAGDIVFYHHADGTCYHVAIATGDGTVLEAAGSDNHDGVLSAEHDIGYCDGTRRYFRPE